MNELFDWMKDIISLMIQMKNQEIQSFLNRIIYERWREQNSKSSLSSITKGKKISWKALADSELKS